MELIFFLTAVKKQRIRQRIGSLPPITQAGKANNAIVAFQQSSPFQKL